MGPLNAAHHTPSGFRMHRGFLRERRYTPDKCWCRRPRPDKQAGGRCCRSAPAQATKCWKSAQAHSSQFTSLSPSPAGFVGLGYNQPGFELGISLVSCLKVVELWHITRPFAVFGHTTESLRFTSDRLVSVEGIFLGGAMCWLTRDKSIVLIRLERSDEAVGAANCELKSCQYETQQRV